MVWSGRRGEVLVMSMPSVVLLPPHANARQPLIHPLIVRLTHWINAVRSS